MKELVFDFECTTFSKGSPFDNRNKAVCLGISDSVLPSYCIDLTNYFNLVALQTKVNNAEILVAFNAKYDLHWLRKLGISFAGKRIWCCQVAEFLLSGQTQPYPSLESTSEKYGFGHKLDAVKLEYWDKGLNTTDVPTEILHSYCIQDVELTRKVYQKQLEQLKENPKLLQLAKLMMQDLLVLEEMEWNGQVFDVQLCNKRAEELDKEIESLREELSKVYPDIPINFGSGDQLSAFLYGGRIPYEEREHIGFYKNGKPKYKNVEKFYELPRLVEPLKGSELKKDGYFKTDEGTLRKLKGGAAKRFVGPLLRLSELEKLNSTYYRGLVKKNVESCWNEGMIHGQFNQCVAATGRLSSSNPNLQNFAGDCLDIFVTRYG